MTDWLWEDRLGGLALGEDEIGKGHTLMVYLHDEPVATLSTDAARALAGALTGWLGGSSSSKLTERLGDTYSTPAGVTFQVYYVHEVADREGQVIACPALGPDLDDGRFTWDEPNVGGVQTRLEWLEEQLTDLAKKHRGLTDGGGQGDDFRPWISVFRMPEDVRVWKGYSYEFDVAAAEECLADVD